MIIKDSDKDTNPENWFNIRRNGLTATDMGYLASKKKSIAKIREEKELNTTIPNNPFMEWGQKMEQVILNYLSMVLDNQPVIANSHIVSWDDDPRCLSTPDAFAEGATVECKTTGKTWDELHNEKLPMIERFKSEGILNYYYQCQWQMLTSSLEQNYFAWNVRETAPIAVQDGLSFTIGDERVTDIDLLFTQGEFAHILMDLDPEAVELMLSIRDDYFAYEPKKSQTIPTEAIELMRDSKTHEAIAKDLRNKALSIVKPLLKAGDSIKGDWGSVSCSERRTTRLDSKKLKSDMPEIFDTYSKESVSEQIRFTIKD